MGDPLPPPTQCESFIFLDLETTGLPFRDIGKARVTELSMISVRREDMKKTDGKIPRILHKLTMQFNPQKMISEEVTDLTGLDNFQLEKEFSFNAKKTNAIRSFLDQCVPPLCLIAHNGNKFDFPLLQEELKNYQQVIPEGTRCADTLLAFREMSRFSECEEKPSFESPFITDNDLAFCDLTKEIEEEISRNAGDISTAMAMIQATNETTPKSQIIGSRPTGPITSRRKLFDDGVIQNKPEKPKSPMKMSFSLKNVYLNLFGENLKNHHRAEDDVIALIQCCLKFGQPLLDWFDTNSREFKDIAAMYDRSRR